MAKLVELGFDATTARHLAERHSPEILQQQLAWLPLRQASTNRLGLLRRAIEQNWPKPKADAIPSEHATGAILARHYAAAVRGDDQPSELCSPKEALLGTEFLRRLGAHAEAPAAEWGRRFGKFVRGKSPQKLWLAWTLPVYGDEFARGWRHTSMQAENSAWNTSRAAHEKKFHSAYQTYLRGEEEHWRKDQPAIYAAFGAYQEELSNRFNLSEKTRALFNTEAGRLSAFTEFMREHGKRLFEFWQWDQRRNPQGWHTRRAEPVRGCDARTQHSRLGIPDPSITG